MLPVLKARCINGGKISNVRQMYRYVPQVFGVLDNQLRGQMEGERFAIQVDETTDKKVQSVFGVGFTSLYCGKTSIVDV